MEEGQSPNCICQWHRHYLIYRNLFPSRPLSLMRAYFAENWLKARRQETDERLLVEAAQRDPRRFAELYELHFHRVYAYVVGWGGRREEAEDLTSDVFH